VRRLAVDDWFDPEAGPCLVAAIRKSALNVDVSDVRWSLGICDGLVGQRDHRRLGRKSVRSAIAERTPRDTRDVSAETPARGTSTATSALTTDALADRQCRTIAPLTNATVSPPRGRRSRRANRSVRPGEVVSREDPV
jgi:hypothetical protein